MRRILITLVVCCLAAPLANAQIAIGGHLSLSGSDRGGPVSFDFRPDISYSFADFCAGVIFRLESSDETEVRQYNWGFSPYFQYYFWSSGPFSLLAEAGCTVTRVHPATGPVWQWEPYLSPALCIELTEHWSVLGYVGNISWDSLSHTWSASLSPDSYQLAVYYAF